MRLPDEMLQTVCFLCVKTKKAGQDFFQYGGTGFFVSVQSETYPDKLQYVYMVTARHNVERASDMGSPMFARLNVNGTGSKIVELRGDWYYPDNPAEDVAVTPWRLRSVTNCSFAEFTSHEIKYFPEHIFATDEVIKRVAIGIGEDIMIVGLFTQRYGTKRNHPIVRSGVIAAMPGEPLQDEKSGGTLSRRSASFARVGTVRTWGDYGRDSSRAASLSDSSLFSTKAFTEISDFRSNCVDMTAAKL